MVKKLVLFLWGVILLPLSLATLYQLPSIFLSLTSKGSAFLPLCFGVVLYILFEGLFNRPLRTYVFGHELSHAIAAVFSGGKVHAMKVSSQGGAVQLSKTNFFIALAPYCVPIYTFFLLVAYYLLALYFPIQKYYQIFLAAIGFSLAFHCSLTFYAIGEDQPDIRKTGFFFSLTLILLVNAWILVLISKIIFRDSISIRAFFSDTMSTHRFLWGWIFQLGSDLWRFLLERKTIPHS